MVCMPNEMHYWSVPIGTWSGVPIRLHLGVVLLVIFLLGLQSGSLGGVAETDDASSRQITAAGTVTVFLLGLSYFAHTWAQLYSLARPAQSVRTICLFPWGAAFQWYPNVPAEYRYQLYVVGLLANLGLLVVAWLVLAAWFAPTSAALWLSVHPWFPQLPVWAHLEQTALMTFVWMNATLLFWRLIPVAPLDMAYLLEHWSDSRMADVSKMQRLSVLFLVAAGASILVLVGGYMIQPQVGGLALSSGIGPLIAGVVLMFAARRYFLLEINRYILNENEARARSRNAAGGPRTLGDLAFTQDGDHAGAFAGDQPMADEESWEVDPFDSVIEEWMDEHRASRQQAREDQAQAEEAMLDDLLLKVSGQGIQSLTDQEREILNRVSQLYRRRRELRL